MPPSPPSACPNPTCTWGDSDDGSTGSWPTEGKLPPGWEIGRTARQIAKVWWVESRADHGTFPICPEPTPEGYFQVYLGRCHPYAKPNGLQYLHRYVAMRALGRVLEPWEHVHHVNGAPRDTTDLGDLRVCEAVDHGHFHYGVRVSCGREIVVWEPRRPDGRFTPYPEGEEYERIFAEAEAGW